jgi:regulator of replication initiation timing
LHRHPEANREEVLRKCASGELEFSALAHSLAEAKLSKKFKDIFNNQIQLYRNLANSENERWQDCIQSSLHSRLMIDALHDPPFRSLSKQQCHIELQFLKNQEDICAKTTTKLESNKADLYQLRKEKAGPNSKQLRLTLIEYIYNTIDQLKILQRVYKKETDLAEVFSKKSLHFFKIVFEKFHNDASSLMLNEELLMKIYKAVKGDPKEAYTPITKTSDKKEINQLREEMVKAVDGMKQQITQKRADIKELMQVVESLTLIVEHMEQTLKQPVKKPTEPPKTPSNRMARFGDIVDSIRKTFR